MSFKIKNGITRPLAIMTTDKFSIKYVSKSKKVIELSIRSVISSNQ